MHHSIEGAGMKTIQTACAHCGQDIEGSTRDGWRDRGGNRLCPAFITRDGEPVRLAGVKHSDKPRARGMLRPGAMVEVGTGRPGYRWAQGWEVRDPVSGRYSTPMRYRDALAMAQTAIDAMQGPACSG
jgi:hypothetical protein